MKMFYGGVPVNSMKVKHYEVSTNDCDMIASDLQAGKTAVARGKKITGTGKSFEFAQYGKVRTNVPVTIPTLINVISITSIENPTKLSIALGDMKNIDFSMSQTVSNVVIDSVEYPVSVNINNGFMTLACDKSIYLQVFYGKDNYT